jgi:hypothetical protein
VRTTVSLDESLLLEAHQAAPARRTTLSAVVAEVVREWLVRRARTVDRARVVLPTAGSGGLQPGADLDDSAGLWDLLDERCSD